MDLGVSIIVVKFNAANIEVMASSILLYVTSGLLLLIGEWCCSRCECI